MLAVLLNVTKDFKRIFIDHGHTFVALLPVSSPLNDANEAHFEERAHTYHVFCLGMIIWC